MLARDAAQRQAQLQNQQPTIKQAQTDGAGDEPEFQTDGLVKQFDASGDEIAMGRIEIDGLLRSKILAMGQNIEGGGLMLPLKEASTKDKRARKVVKRSAVGDGQVDGGDDDDDPKDDEDAINSDLDDPDDGLNEDEDGEDDMGHIMLCMYDKVQRVKNKWLVFSFSSCLPSYPPIWLYASDLKHVLLMLMIMSLQEVCHERWCPHRQRQGVRLPQG